jgi:hypothetical protein
MKGKIIIISLCIICSPILLANDNELTPEQIDRQVANRRQSIENYYKGQVLEVTLRAEEELRQLEIDDSLVYKSLEAHTLAAELVSGTDRSRDDHWLEPDRKIKTWTLDRPHYFFGFSGTSGRRHRRSGTFGVVVERPYTGGYYKTLTKNFTRRFVDAKTKINETKNRIIAQREAALLSLEIQMQRALTIGLDEYKKRLQALPNTAEKKKQPENVVTGILYSDDNPAALLNGKIIHVGDEFEDEIKITAITTDSVKFEKDDKTWSQAVGQKPHKNW